MARVKWSKVNTAHVSKEGKKSERGAAQQKLGGWLLSRNSGLRQLGLRRVSLPVARNVVRPLLVIVKPGGIFRVTPKPGISPRISEFDPRPILLACY